MHYFHLDLWYDMSTENIYATTQFLVTLQRVSAMWYQCYILALVLCYVAIVIFELYFQLIKGFLLHLSI